MKQWIAPLAVLAILLMCAPAHAARSIRLMYEAPAATEGGPAVTVTFEDQREEKKGGKDPTLVANERGSYNIPLGVKSGKGGTGHAPDVVPNWIVDVLKSAGYAAERGEAGEGPRVHVALTKLWGDQIQFPGGSRHQFGLQVALSIFPAGATEAAWTESVQAGGGTTTVVLRFDDPVENGFVRAFDEATAQVAALMASPEWQAALPGGNAEAAAAAVAGLGQDAKKEKAKAKVEAEGGAVGDTTTQDDGVTLTAADVPEQFKTIQPGVWQWMSQPDHTQPKLAIEGFVFTGVAAGLLVGGEVWASQLAQTKAMVANPLPTVNSIAHIPPSAPPDAEWIVQAAVSEIMVSYGAQILIPSLGSTIPTLIAANTGQDLQTTKAVLGIAGAASFIPTGAVMLNRFGTHFAPQWTQHMATQDRWVHLGTGLFPLVFGVVDLALGTVYAVVGVLYAANKLTARADEKGLISPATDGRRGLKNSAAWVIPMATPTEDGGLTLGLMGTF